MVKNKNNKEIYFYSILKETKRSKLKTSLRTLKDSNGFVRVDPRFLTMA